MPRFEAMDDEFKREWPFSRVLLESKLIEVGQYGMTYKHGLTGEFFIPWSEEADLNDDEIGFNWEDDD